MFLKNDYLASNDWEKSSGQYFSGHSLEVIFIFIHLVLKGPEAKTSFLFSWHCFVNFVKKGA